MRRVNYFFLVAAVSLVSACATPAVSTDASGGQTLKSGYAPINGIKVYYEIHGSGGSVPLVLLHGGGSTIDVTYGRILPIFARHRTVIALEEQGHGRTSDRDLPFRPETSADDVDALLQYLHVERADIMGFSNGAGVAMQVAIRHPRRVRKMIFTSYMTKKKGAYPGFWEAMKKADFSTMPQALKDAFLKVNPDRQALKRMCEKDIERMQSFQDIPDKDVRSIRAPSLIILGDQDVPKPEHAVELSHMIPGSRLIILPGTHGEFLGELLTEKEGSHAPEFTAGFVEEFLDR